MTKVYYDRDCNFELLKNKKIAVIGFGSQGHAHALNLKDSGADVIVGLYNGSKSWKRAEDKGFKVLTVDQATKESDIIMMLVPDEVQRKVYSQYVKENLTEGKALAFAHGFNIHFNQIIPPKNVDVFMIAPKGPGHLVRRVYEQGNGVPALLAVHQDYSGNTKDLALAYAMGI